MGGHHGVYSARSLLPIRFLSKQTASVHSKLKKMNKVNEGVFPEYIGIVNYGIIGLIQLQMGYSDDVDITPERALELYDGYVAETKNLMSAKNHDYDEAWRSMRVSSYTDLILTKIYRIKKR